MLLSRISNLLYVLEALTVIVVLSLALLASCGHPEHTPAPAFVTVK